MRMACTLQTAHRTPHTAHCTLHTRALVHTAGAPLLLSALTPAARALLRGLLPAPRAAAPIAAADEAARALLHGSGEAALPPPPPPVLVGAGAPLLVAMPTSLAWWPIVAPWRVCQEGAALLARGAARRVLRVTTAEAAAELLASRRVGASRLAELRAEGRLLGLETCEAAACEAEARGARLPGAAVLVLPAPPGAQRHSQPLAVAALLDGEGLALLASDDLLSRFAQLCCPPRLP